MRKLLIILTLFSFIFADKISQIKTSHKIRIGIKYNTKPFGYKVGRTIKGFDLELSKLLVKKLKDRLHLKKLKVFYKKVVPANREKYLLNNKVDLVVATYTITDKRKKLIDFSIPYFKDPVVIVSNSNTPKKVGVLKGSTTKNIVEKLGYKTEEFLDYPKMFESFKNGKIDAISTNASILNDFIKTNRYKVIKTGVVEEYGIGMVKDEKFKKLIDDILISLKKDGEIEKLYKKYFKE